ncbi:hypothetical protein [Streptomyces luteogriseus]
MTHWPVLAAAFTLAAIAAPCLHWHDQRTRARRAAARRNRQENP